jgi:flagellar basal-body rod protein FlgG
MTIIQSLFSAVSGLRTASRSLQTSADNLANLQTSGFKKSRAASTDVVSGGTQISAILRDQSPGSILTTGSEFDLAIDGEGFFQVSRSGGGTGFTRAGSFRLDSSGTLVTANGDALNPAIQIPAGSTSVSIEPNGLVTATVNGSQVTVGQIEIATFNNPGGLQAQGGGLFLETAASGSPVAGVPGASNAGRVISGAIETSNVDIAEEVVNQILAKTAFKANANVIRTADEMIGTILDIKT